MFDGKVGVRNVRAGGNKKDLVGVEEARKLREKRALEKQRFNAAVKIQSQYRSFSCRWKHLSTLRADFDTKMKNISGIKAVFQQRNLPFSVPLDTILPLIELFVLFHNHSMDGDRRIFLEKLLIESYHNISNTFNYADRLCVDSFLVKDLSWSHNRLLFQIRKLCGIAMESLRRSCVTVDSNKSLATAAHFEADLSFLDSLSHTPELSSSISFISRTWREKCTEAESSNPQPRNDYEILQVRQAMLQLLIASSISHKSTEIFRSLLMERSINVVSNAADVEEQGRQKMRIDRVTGMLVRFLGTALSVLDGTVAAVRAEHHSLNIIHNEGFIYLCNSHQVLYYCIVVVATYHDNSR